MQRKTFQNTEREKVKKLKKTIKYSAEWIYS